MANTRIRLEIEEWVRTGFLRSEFSQSFSKHGLLLETGGSFEFDAVSADRSIVANISTASARTSSGRLASGRMNKIRSDMLFLTMVDAEQRLIVLTQGDLLDYWQEQKAKGRAPNNVDYRLAQIPKDLAEKLEASKAVASQEMSRQ